MNEEWTVSLTDGTSFVGTKVSENSNGFVFEDVTYNGDYFTNLYVPSTRIRMMTKATKASSEQIIQNDGVQIRLTEGGEN